MSDSLTAIIFNIQRFSTEDGPGIRTTVFMKGCPLACTWCHNPEGISPKPQTVWYDTRCIACRDCQSACPAGVLNPGAAGMEINREDCLACGKCAETCPAGALELIGATRTLDSLLDEVMRDEVFYGESGGGVTVSGGEPLMQPAFTTAFLAACRAKGLHTALDTTAYAAREKLLQAMEHACLVLLDVKTLDPAVHREMTGVPLDPIAANIREAIAPSGLPVWVRTPVIPGCTDSDENISAIARFISENIPSCQRWDLLAFGNLCTSKYARLGMKFAHEKTPLLKKARLDALRELAASQCSATVTSSCMTARED